MIELRCPACGKLLAKCEAEPNTTLFVKCPRCKREVTPSVVESP